MLLCGKIVVPLQIGNARSVYNNVHLRTHMRA